MELHQSHMANACYVPVPSLSFRAVLKFTDKAPPYQRVTIHHTEFGRIVPSITYLIKSSIFIPSHEFIGLFVTIFLYNGLSQLRAHLINPRKHPGIMKKFSHVKNFTGYMTKVYHEINKSPVKQDILDIPAGNGLLSEKLSKDGHNVVCADINSERTDYVYADMESTLPFEDQSFDTIMCLEGIEHVIEPSRLVSELCRISRSDSRIIVSLPNIHNLYSRLQFLLTGTFFQFEPYANQYILNEKIDRGHISSLSVVQLKYLFACNGAKLKAISGDKFKRKILLPVLSPLLLLGMLWTRTPKFRKRWNGTKAKTSPNWLFHPNLVLSRSLILVFEKKSSQPTD